MGFGMWPGDRLCKVPHKGQNNRLRPSPRQTISEPEGHPGPKKEAFWAVNIVCRQTLSKLSLGRKETFWTVVHVHPRTAQRSAYILLVVPYVVETRNGLERTFNHFSRFGRVRKPPKGDRRSIRKAGLPLLGKTSIPRPDRGGLVGVGGKKKAGPSLQKQPYPPPVQLFLKCLR